MIQIFIKGWISDLTTEKAKSAMVLLNRIHAFKYMYNGQFKVWMNIELAVPKVQLKRYYPHCSNMKLTTADILTINRVSCNIISCLSNILVLP